MGGALGHDRASMASHGRLRKWMGFCGLLIGLAFSSAAEEPPEPPPGEGAPLPMSHAVWLGIVEGVTEFLPVSSTGHLVLTNHLLDLDREAGAASLDGEPLWETSPDEATAEEPAKRLTVKAAADTYAIAIQAGAIAAVGLIYWRQLLSILAGLLGRDPRGLRLLRNLLIAFFPAVVLGLLFEDLIDAHLFSIETVAAALVAGAVTMTLADLWRRRRAAMIGEALPDPAPADLSPRQALLIGVLQCFAMWPGMSRSMMTIVGGYVVGLRPARAAEFSFLLGLPTLAGAAIYKTMGNGDLVVSAFGWQPLLIGCLVAAVAAGLSVRWLVGYLNRHGLTLFAIYRVALAVAVLLVMR
ncbi:MAG: undecaprenyl-diphosphate phosphatase [Opitutaceae bacterium]